MKLKNLFFTLVATVVAMTVPAMAQENAAAATQPAPLVLTLEQALEIALSENPTV